MNVQGEAVLGVAVPRLGVEARGEGHIEMGGDAAEDDAELHEGEGATRAALQAAVEGVEGRAVGTEPP